jgi:putative ABC transport system permease protein
MLPGILQIVTKSIWYYKKPVLYQVLIIALLCAVITGSLLTGSSVKASLKRSCSERLGNTNFLISSGVRYIDSSLADRLNVSYDISSIGILEINGYCQGMNSQKVASGIHIYGINSGFFRFHGRDSVLIKQGEIAVNKRLAQYLGLKTGDELILRFNGISEIPADSPFAPAKGISTSVVLKVGSILEPENIGNFSLSISQILPLNVFINMSDLPGGDDNKLKINRVLIENTKELSKEQIFNELKKVLKPSDIGLKLRFIKNTDEFELISDRIFIEKTLIEQIEKVIPSSAPVITYLGNKFKTRSGSTPYSFISALPSSLYPEISGGNEILISSWLAKDLNANEKDTLELYWYSPDSLNKLIERSNKFIIKRIVDMHGIWSDSLLMPDFPGISGSASCTDWDAGVPIRMNEIRQKDEIYWNKFRGTPKAFISYVRGKELWGNNFGPATAMRFPAEMQKKEIEDKLNGSFDPGKSGFTITNLSDDSAKAANESVDFGTLFLSLGFFLILASIVLLSFAVSTYFDSKKGQITTLFAIGFNNRWIGNLIFLESGFISLAGCLTGALAGSLVNILITKALNTVWQGAVQTDTLKSFISLQPFLIGFISTFILTMVFMMVKIKFYLNNLNRIEKEYHHRLSSEKNLFFLIVSSFSAIAFFALSFFNTEKEIALSFAAGTVLLVAMILFIRQLFLLTRVKRPDKQNKLRGLSILYYSCYPSHAITPILFISAGIFAVFITGANKMNFDVNNLKRSDGTGGYLLWCENAIPIKEDISTISGKKALGLDDEEISSMSYVLARRSSDDDASCLNLNHVTAPPLLGIDPGDFIFKGSFSFVKRLSDSRFDNSWQFLNFASENNIIYGIADQTVLEWGLKIKTGDTLKLRAENGQPLNIIIAGGLKSSIFQGYVLIGMKNFAKYYPSVSGSNIILVDGKPEQLDIYKNILGGRLDNHGINIEKTTDRLASFYEVTNTYLSVFGMFGALGMITGIAGLGFVLLRNYNHRKREFALMLATGFPVKKIRGMLLSEMILILCAGVLMGVISAIIATLPSLTSSPDIPWLFLSLMILAIILTGLVALVIAVKEITNDSITSGLRKE